MRKLPAVLVLLLPALLVSEISLASEQHIVGGDAGWSTGANYTDWVLKNQFHVGDALLFKYQSDSVLEVNRNEFDACITTRPINHHSDGNTLIRLARLGPHWFISGNKNHCDQGQKFGIMVTQQNSPPASGGGSGGSGSPSTPASSAPAPSPRSHRSHNKRSPSAAASTSAAPDMAPAHPPSSDAAASPSTGFLASLVAAAALGFWIL